MNRSMGSGAVAEGNNVDVRIARLEEWRRSIDDETLQARAARADIHDDLERVQITIGQFDTRLDNLNASIVRMETLIGETRSQLGDAIDKVAKQLGAAIERVAGDIGWVVKIILAAVIMAVLALVVGAGSGHLQVR